jgi:hypothetical protein
MVGIAQPVEQRATDLTARVQFSGITSFSFVLFSYALLTSLCINAQNNGNSSVAASEEGLSPTGSASLVKRSRNSAYKFAANGC